MADETNTGATGAQGATDMAQGAADRMKAAGTAMADHGQQLGMKMIDQAETNTREAFNAMRAAAGAKDLSEVMRVQGDFIRDQGSRSMTQAREIGELIASFGRNAMSGMTGKN